MDSSMVVMSSTLFSASAVSDVCRGMEMADKYDCSSIEVASGLPEWIHSARRLPDFWLTKFFLNQIASGFDIVYAKG